MDMDVIQEFTENQSYLNALSQSSREIRLDIDLKAAPEAFIEECRRSVTLEAVMSSPISRMFFAEYLCQCQGEAELLFLDDVAEFESLPYTGYRRSWGRKILRNYFGVGRPRRSSRRTLPWVDAALTAAVVEGVNKNEAQAFRVAKEAAMSVLCVSALPAFLFSPLFERYCCFVHKGSVNVMLDSFTLIRILGEGGFGKVLAVSKDDTRALYACKTVSKAKIAERKREQLIINERNVLAVVDHPFIVNLKYAFQDKSALYLVMDLLSGGELAYHLHRLGPLPEDMVQFYSGCIVLALEYLHSQNISYRDLKPENIMLDSDGYVKLTDLGLCSFIQPGERLYQHCGTRSYMAPEQCYGEDGYVKTADWWSLGMTIFFLLTGKNPFSRKYRRRHKRRYREERRQRKVLEARTQQQPQQQQQPQPGSEDEEKQYLTPDLRPRRAPEEDVQGIELVDTHRDGGRATTRTFFTKVGSSPAIAVAPGRETRTLGQGTRGTASPAADKKHAPETVRRSNETPEQRAERYAELEHLYRDTMRRFPWGCDLPPLARSLIRDLLAVDYEQRLGHRGADDIKQHAFFNGLDWDKLARRHLPPPFIPDQSFVNAKFLESTQQAIPIPDPNAAHFPEFDFVRAHVFEEELTSTLSDKLRLLGFPSSSPTAATTRTNPKTVKK